MFISNRRILVILFGLTLFGGCSGKQVVATPNGTEIASWAHKPAPEKIDKQHVQTVDLPKGTRVELSFGVGTIAVGDSKDVQSPVSVTVKVVDAGGAEVGARVDGPMHYAGDPLNARTVNVNVSMLRGGPGCTGTTYTNDTAHIKLRADGKVEMTNP